MKEALGKIEGYDTSRLGALVDTFAEEAAKLTATEPSDPIAFNDGSIRISRAINTVYYSRSGPFDQDPNELIPRFPGLHAEAPPGVDRAFLKVRLKREENRIEEGLRDAIATAQALSSVK
jgi:hypothetical protein